MHCIKVQQRLTSFFNIISLYKFAGSYRRVAFSTQSVLVLCLFYKAHACLYSAGVGPILEMFCFGKL